MLMEKAGKGQYMLCRIPGIVMTEDDTLLAYYECRDTFSDWAQIDIKIIRSIDEGDTWKTSAIIPGNGDTLNNPVMFVKGQELHLLFLKNYKELYHCVSTDDGKTFSVPVRKEFSCDFFYNVVAVGPGHGIVHNGRMIVPAWFAQNKEDPKAHGPSIIATLYSDDGSSWKLGEVIGHDILKNPSECALAITKENKILISIRQENEEHLRAFALSENGVSNWSDVYFHPQIPDPVCMGSMCQENGTIYHINCDCANERENLTVKISDDCFNTFESIAVDNPAGYSDIAVKNGTLYILYERFSPYNSFNETDGGLYFKRI